MRAELWGPLRQETMLTWRDRFRILLNFATPEVTEFQAGLCGLAWGLWLLLPGDMFVLYPAFFTAMMRLAPEWVWGLAVACSGFLQAFLAPTVHWPARRFMALHGCAMWAFLGTLYLQAEWRAPGVGLTFSLSLANAWAFYRLRRWASDGDPGAGVDAE